MKTETESQDILRRMRELEEENARLRKVAKSTSQVQLTVSEGEYKGHPILTFEGSFPRFSLGLKKLGIIKQAWPQVESFLKQHSKERSDQTISDDDKI